MNTYQPIKLESGRWAIERFVDGESRGLMFGRYPDELAATYMANVFANMEKLASPKQHDTA